MSEEKEKVKKPFYKRVWFIVLVALVAFGLIGKLASQQDSTTMQQTSDNTSPQNTKKQRNEKIKIADPFYQKQVTGSDIHEAAYYGNLDKIRQIIKDNPKKIDKIHVDFTPLNVACFEGKIAGVEVLIDLGADLNHSSYKESSPIERVLSSWKIKEHNKQFKLIALLIRRGLKLTKHGPCLLGSAVIDTKGYMPIIELLLNNGADIDGQTNECRTALNFSIDRGYFKLCEYLINKGANVNHVCKTGTSTPLIEAISEYSGATGRKKSQGYSRDIIKGTYRDILNLLLKNGADVNLAANKTKLTPLHIAAMSDLPEVCAVLIARGAKVNRIDNDGRTPLDWTGSQEVATIIRKAGGRRARNL